MVTALPGMTDSDAAGRPFGAVDLLQLVLEAMRPSLGFDLAVAVLREDNRNVVPIYAAGALSAGVIEGVHVQATFAFSELAGAEASWEADEPVVIQLSGSDGRLITEPDAYEDAPLVVGGVVTGMLRIAAREPLTKPQRDLYFTMASDVSRAIERLDAQRTQARHVQERLLQSEKMSSVGQLVSGVAHELNNPLTGVMGFAQLLLLRDLDEAARKQIETIYAEAERASKIVSNLLTFARRRKAHKEPANLNTLLERVLELRNYDLRVRNIDVELQLDAALPDTMLDTNQIQQVFLNIIINAEQAMRGDDGEAAGTLRITTAQQGESVIVRFQDSGAGMSAETLRRIFDPFFTTKDAGDGTGLGLTICYGIVEDHGGRISAESTVGRGTTFIIELPIVAGMPVVPRDASPDATNGAPVEARRILVVDDESTIQQLLTGVLQMDGHDVTLASNGREALDRIAGGDFDLIISDIKMPVMSGADMFRELERTGNPLASRVIFITGDVVAPETRKFLQTVDTHVLSKPFRLRDVRESVRATLSR